MSHALGLNVFSVVSALHPSVHVLLQMAQVRWVRIRRDLGFLNHLRQTVILGGDIQRTLNQNLEADVRADEDVERIRQELNDVSVRADICRAGTQKYQGRASASSSSSSSKVSRKLSRSLQELETLEQNIEELRRQLEVAEQTRARTLARAEESQRSLQAMNMDWVNQQITIVSNRVEGRLRNYVTPRWVTVVDQADMTAIVMKRALGGELLFTLGTSVKEGLRDYLTNTANFQLGIQGFSSDRLYSVNGGISRVAGQEAINRVAFLPPPQRYNSLFIHTFISISKMFFFFFF